MGTEFRESPIFHVRRKTEILAKKFFGMSVRCVPGNISGKAVLDIAVRVERLLLCF